MGATEHMCGVEIWKGESFEGLRSSRERKSLSLNDEKLKSIRCGESRPQITSSHRNEQVIAITSPVPDVRQKSVPIKRYAP